MLFLFPISPKWQGRYFRIFFFACLLSCTPLFPAKGNNTSVALSFFEEVTSPEPQEASALHIVDDFSFLESEEERTAAKGALHMLAASLDTHDSLLFATPVFHQESLINIHTFSFTAHIAQVAAPHYCAQTLAVLPTAMPDSYFAIAHLIRV
ncbi:MAG: hypothetical protein C0514_03035 [Candidatus Puniceispirillum sp.]|nr:hypothetical protein [Candidatus Puniceispirillum sp.]